MKTTKAILSVVIFLSATVAMAQSEAAAELDPSPTSPPSVSIYLKQALQNRGLVYAMRTQLNPDFLQVDRPLYSVPVKYQHRIVIVVGPGNAWKKFFNLHDETNALSPDVKRIPLRTAMTDPRLVKAMHQQLTPALIREDKPSYTAKIKFNQKMVYVFASRSEWKWFFQAAINPGIGGS